MERMPELPEVELVRRKLNATVKGQKIEKVTILTDRIIRTPTVEVFQQKIKNQTIIDVDRRGKHLLFRLDDYALVSHLRMEGKYRLTEKNEPLNKHDHVIFFFENGMQLRYHDVRKFGTMDLVQDEKEVKSIRTLGLEPLDEHMNASYLNSILSRKKSSIKQALLDQTVVAGLGNIYVDEVLHHALVHPVKLANSLNYDELCRVTDSMKTIIQLAIANGGSSIRTYESMGEKGSMQNLHKVYNKANEPCIRCSSLIQKIKIGGRGTHFCPVCQPNK